MTKRSTHTQKLQLWPIKFLLIFAVWVTAAGNLSYPYKETYTLNIIKTSHYYMMYQSHFRVQIQKNRNQGLEEISATYFKCSYHKTNNKTPRSLRKLLLELIDIFITLIIQWWFSWMYAHVQTHQIGYVNYVEFFVYQADLSKSLLKKIVTICGWNLIIHNYFMAIMVDWYFVFSKMRLCFDS